MKNRLLSMLNDDSNIELPDPGRRRLLQASGVGLAGLAAGGSLLKSEPAKAVNTSARIVIVGGGAAGISAANRLSRGLSGAQITIIERREQHIYQPGLTLVATGIWRQSKVLDRNERYMPRGINWIRGMVTEFDPDANQVVTDTGQVVEYDYLMVTTGLKVDFDAIEGMSPDLIGRDGIGCVYDNSDHAARTWQAIDRFADQGGVGLFTRPAGGIKCAGAPLKVCHSISSFSPTQWPRRVLVHGKRLSIAQQARNRPQPRFRHRGRARDTVAAHHPRAHRTEARCSASARAEAGAATPARHRDHGPVPESTLGKGAGG